MSRKKPGTILALKDYCKRLWSSADFRAADADLVNESDRALIVFKTVRVEEALRWRLEQSLPGLTGALRSALFDTQRPLGTFSAMIDVAEALALMTPADAKKVHYLREIRNLCAHTHKHLSFEVTEMRDAVRLLVPSEFAKRVPPLGTRSEARDAFLAFASFYAMALYEDRQIAIAAYELCYNDDVASQ